MSIIPWNRPGTSPCHPNAAGMRGAADLILDTLGTLTPTMPS